MQTPAPFDYERATSVDHALALLERHGPEARLVAGGHSLLPMMKLRLARPECLIDINDLADLAYIRLRRRRAARSARMTRHAELLESPLARRALPDLPRRRAGDRRPDRAQPRHRRRVAVPGRPVRGPVGRVRRGRRHVRDPRRRRRAHGAGPRVPHRPVRDRRRAGRDRWPRSGCRSARAAAARTRRSSAGPATGPWPPPAPRVVARRRHRRRRRHRSDRRRRRRTSARAEAEDVLRGQADRGEPRRGRRDRRPSTATRSADQRGPVDYKRHLAGELDRSGAASCGRPSPGTGGLTDAGHRDRQRRGRTRADVEPAAAAGALPARRAGSDRHPLGLRHIQLRRVHGVDGRRCR